MHILIYNKIKIYPDFKQVVEFKTPIVNLNALTDLEKITRKRKNSNNRPDFSSVSRTRIAIRDIVLCNDFDWFCTFTFAKNRDDVDHCKTQFAQWLKNQKPHSPDLTYLAVPEWHKDKKAIHFHVLLKNYAGVVKPTEFRTKKGFKVFQIPGYRLGYNTAVPITKTNENKEKVANYITKYVSKDLVSKYNKKRYWCSRGLVRPEEYSNIVRQSKYFNSDDLVFENDEVKIYKKYSDNVKMDS